MSSEKQHDLTFILSGGGTGGHIYPAIAIADELKYRLPKCRIHFVGAKGKMEMQKVPQAGYTIDGLWISGIQRKFDLKLLLFPLKLLVSLIKSYFILKKYNPDVVIGTGGFASGPLVKVATWLGIPTLIQEQNSFPGITNKWIAPKASKICVAYEGMERFFPKDKIVFTGNPVRQDLTHVDSKQPDAFSYFALDAGKKTLLVLGGSLGARKINELIAQHLELLEEHDIQLIWQCGKLYFEEYTKFNSNPNVKVFSFIDRMDYAYSVADIIISRAGASSVSELCLIGKPTLFIPSPNVAEDHQTKNAKVIADMGGAILLKESQLQTEFEKNFLRVLNDAEKVEKMKLKMKKLAKPNATIEIVNEVIQLISKSVSK